jgi:hypothetical protein
MTQGAQSRFEIAILPVNVYLHVFPDSDASDFRHTQMPHGVTHRIPLRI